MSKKDKDSNKEDNNEEKQEDLKFDSVDKELNEMIDKFNKEEEKRKPFVADITDEEALEELDKIKKLDEKSLPLFKELKKLNKKLNLLYKERDLYREKFLSRIEDIEDDFKMGRYYRVKKKEDEVLVLEEIIFTSTDQLDLLKRRLTNLLNGAGSMPIEEFHMKFANLIKDSNYAMEDLYKEQQKIKDDEDTLFIF